LLKLRKFDQHGRVVPAGKSLKKPSPKTCVPINAYAAEVPLDHGWMDFYRGGWPRVRNTSTSTPTTRNKRMPLPRWLPHDLLRSPNSAASVVVPVTPSRAAPTPSAGRCGLKALPAPKSKRHMNLSDDTRESLLRVPGAPPVPARRPAPCLCINAFQTACVTVTGYGAVHRTDDPVNRQISQ